MHIVLSALDNELFSAWQASCGNLDGVSSGLRCSSPATARSRRGRVRESRSGTWSHGHVSFPRTWADAQERHLRLHTNTTRDQQYDPRDWKADVAQAIRRAERHRKRLDRFRTRLRRKHGLQKRSLSGR